MGNSEDQGIMKVLKWAGIIALIAVPVYMVLKKKSDSSGDAGYEDEANIFASELEE